MQIGISQTIKCNILLEITEMQWQRALRLCPQSLFDLYSLRASQLSTVDFLP